MITIKKLRSGKWDVLVQVGGLVPVGDTFVSEDAAREWANKTDHDLRAVRADLLAIALGNRGKPRRQKKSPPGRLKALITPAIERFLQVYGCAGELPLDLPKPRKSWWKAN